MDSMINIISHELSESVTDPQGTAWYDSNGYEDADKCAWQFGTVTTTAGRYWNEPIAFRNFLIQMNWALHSQTCSN
jgi:hypothetical protein